MEKKQKFQPWMGIVAAFAILIVIGIMTS